MRWFPLVVMSLSGMATAGPRDIDGDGFDDAVIDRHLMIRGSAKGAITGAVPSSPRAANLMISSAEVVGDVNGDGFADVVVGDPGCGNVADDLPACETGAIHLFLGSAKGLAAKPAQTRTATAKDTMFGGQVVAVGDLDGDGRADLVVVDKTGAHLFAGSAKGLADKPVELPAEQVVAAGDVDGDKRADLVVASKGKAFVWSGGDPKRATALTLPANATFVTAGHGDFDGDGFVDLAVTSQSTLPSGQYAPNVVSIYRGSARGIAAKATAQLSRGEGRAMFGSAFASVGDLDGDKRDDLVIAAACATFDAKNRSCLAGAAYVYLGSARGLGTTPAHTLAPARKNFAVVGNALTALGDIDGDKRPDFAFGAYVYRGGKGGLVDAKPPSL